MNTSISTANKLAQSNALDWAMHPAAPLAVAPIPSRPGPLALLRPDFSNTPGRVRTVRNLCMALALGFCAFFMAYQGQLLHTFKVIGRDSAPSIIMAENIRYLLADANAFALQAGAQSDPAARSANFEEARKKLDRARGLIVEASSNITYGDEERVPLTDIAKALGAYDQALGSAATSGFDYTTLARADQIMRDKALAAASALDQANYVHLDKAFASHAANALGSAIPALSLALVLMAFLLWAQVDLFRHTNRILNKGYLGASFACLFFFLLASFYTLTAESALRIAKKDAFDSIHALWMAKSVAYEAKSSRTAMVLASGKPADVDARQLQYLGFARRISSLDAAGLRMAVLDGRKFGGYLGDEFANITFDGERDAALAAAKGWACYSDIDPSSVVALKASRLDLASQPAQDVNGKPGCFEAFSAGIDKAIAINQRVFDEEVDKAMSRISYLPWLAIGCLMLCLGGCYFGAKPRLDEYRF